MSLTVKNFGGGAKLTGDATEADVLKGKTFYSDDARTKKTGTAKSYDQGVTDGKNELKTSSVESLWSKYTDYGIGDTYEFTKAYAIVVISAVLAGGESVSLSMSGANYKEVLNRAAYAGDKVRVFVARNVPAGATVRFGCGGKFSGTIVGWN